jgi:hypothetical protein
MMGKLVALLGAIAIICWQSSQIHRWHKQFTAEHAGRLGDRISYEQAQRDAKITNQNQISRTAQKQQEITDATVSSLQHRLELIRSELRKASAAHQGSSGSAAAGEASATPCRANDPAWMCVSPEERLRAAENEERHDQLIDWNLKQSKIDPNKE